jgi:hypothetical protein
MRTFVVFHCAGQLDFTLEQPPIDDVGYFDFCGFCSLLLRRGWKKGIRFIL